MGKAPGPTALLAFPGLLTYMPFLAGVTSQRQVALGPVGRGTFGLHGPGLLSQATFVLGGATHILSLLPTA